MPNLQDPYRRVQFLKTDMLLEHQLTTLGMQGIAVARDPFVSNRDALENSVINELAFFENTSPDPRSLEQITTQVKGMNKKQLAAFILNHRIENGTFLGFKFLSKLVVSNIQPFSISFSPARIGHMKMVVKFSVTKSRIVHTANQPVQLVVVY